MSEINHDDLKIGDLWSSPGYPNHHCRWDGKDWESLTIDQYIRLADLYSDRAFNDVGRFHSKFDLPNALLPSPRLLPDDVAKYRSNFMQEELDEFNDSVETGDLAGQADALVDLVYVALGTAHMMGLPWVPLWDDVQRANMSKERATSANDSRSKRSHSLDVVKPEGWKGPKTQEILDEWS